MRPVICWFRQDLRLADNPALAAAQADGSPIVALFVLDDETPGIWRAGGASRWWLHHSLQSLGDSLEEIGGSLVLRRGRAESVVCGLADEMGAKAVVWNRAYEPYAIERDKRLKAALLARGIGAESFGGSLLREPWEVRTAAGTPFKVFTPYWRAGFAQWQPSPPLPAPTSLRSAIAAIESESLADWNLTPSNPDWSGGLRTAWHPGEPSAQFQLSGFLARLSEYAGSRDAPAAAATSRLSPHLHFGEISPRQIWHAVSSQPPSSSAEKFLSEIGWREFSHHLLFYNPQLPHAPLDPKFAAFPWSSDAEKFVRWTRGRTGFPIVDAGMRELWATGWMHNRVRMIAASFLVKQLGVDWRRGAEWFWDTLVDADLANNSASWQWVAGCGTDAAPFFRIFNPVLQGEKFDPHGAYVRRWVPELQLMPDEFIHKPWTAPSELRKGAKSYPEPIVDLAAARARALEAYRSLSAP
ncbi:MAG TPA: deoxyribodipyrimidine photo-lyase [Rhizomicrobium sp.]|nr:deoxyribodipyrimidine photo-lyase [Rhizomicrobium sp.]